MRVPKFFNSDQFSRLFWSKDKILLPMEAAEYSISSPFLDFPNELLQDIIVLHFCNSELTEVQSEGIPPSITTQQTESKTTAHKRKKREITKNSEAKRRSRIKAKMNYMRELLGSLSNNPELGTHFSGNLV